MTIHFTAAQRAAVFGLRMAGQSIGTVAAIMGCSDNRITRELPQDWRGTLKSVLRAPPPRPRRPYGARRVRDPLVIALHDGGKRTLQEVGDLLGITRERVRQIVARNGVSVRNNGVLPLDVHRERLGRFTQAVKPGLTTTEVLAAAGLSYGEVQNAALALGVSMPKTVRKERHSPPAPEPPAVQRADDIVEWGRRWQRAWTSHRPNANNCVGDSFGALADEIERLRAIIARIRCACASTDPRWQAQLIAEALREV